MANGLNLRLGGLLLAAVLGILAFGSTGQPIRTAAQDVSIPVEVILENNYLVRFDGVVYHDDGASTWNYTVEELPEAQDLSNWVLETPFCAPILDAGPKPWEIVDPDPNAQLSGVKWETKTKFEQGQFWVRLDTSGQVAITNVAAKGPDLAFDEIAGPGCVEADPPDDPPGDPPIGSTDQEPPTIDWIEPVPEGGVFDVLEGTSVDLIVEATDDVGVVRVEFLRWDAIKKKFMTMGVDFTDPYWITVVDVELNPTWNQVFAASFDDAGNRSDWDWIWLYRITSGSLFNPTQPGIYIPLVIR